MISSDIPVFIARLALWRTWLEVCCIRSLKKSRNVGRAGIFSSFFTFAPASSGATEYASLCEEVIRRV